MDDEDLYFFFFQRLQFQFFCTNSAVVPRTLPFKAELKVSEPLGSSLWHIILWLLLDQRSKRTAKLLLPFFSLFLPQKMCAGQDGPALRMFVTHQLVLVKFTAKCNSHKVAGCGLTVHGAISSCSALNA